jgi:hypothetical protein
MSEKTATRLTHRRSNLGLAATVLTLALVTGGFLLSTASLPRAQQPSRHAATAPPAATGAVGASGIARAAGVPATSTAKAVAGRPCSPPS